MTNNRSRIVIGISLAALILALAVGPLVAGYIVAGAGLAVVVALIGASVGREVRNWSLDHRWPHLPRWRRRHAA
jgi:hypothetical protein